MPRSRSRLRFLTKLALVLAVVLTFPRFAAAGEKEDAATLAAVDKILTNDVANANFGEAKKKLRGLLDKCKKGCSAGAVARVYVATGIVSAQIGQTEDAKSAWADALSLDPNATLPQTGVSQSVKDQFAAAQKAWLVANPQQDDAQKAGWASKQAFDLAKQALVAEQAQQWTDCIEKDRAALQLEENMRARLHLAMCEAKAGKIVDALRDNAKVLEAARAKGDATTAKIVQERVTELLPRLAHVKFEAPKNVTDLKITFDDKLIPTERLNESFTVDPGEHNVHAEATLRGVRVKYDGKTAVEEGMTEIVKLKLQPAGLTEGQLKCMVEAVSPEEALKCLPSDSKPLVVHAGLDVSGYTDSTATHVLTPGVRGSVTSPTAGWNVGASYLVDIVTSASPDVVAQASPRFNDVRHAATANGGWKPGAYGFQAFGSYSEESDYISRTLGASVLGDFAEKQFTPQLGYSYTWDLIGRAGTPYDVYSKGFSIHEFNLGSTIISSPTSLWVIGGAVQLEDGDQSKPYRYIPMFAPGVSVPVGASVDEVNRNRLPVKPLEQLPLDRQRFSFGVRYIGRARSTATLRIEERLYTDTWGIKASTTDLRYMIDTSPKLRVWPHLHLHGQTGTSFYQRVYGAEPDPGGTVPMFRTSDRELSPMVGLTGGGGARYTFTEPGSSVAFAVFATGDALFNYYFNALYIQTRLAFYGTIGVEADFE